MTISLPVIQDAHLLTHSRMSTFKTCAKKHYYAYEIGLRRASVAKPLRMGAAIHLGRDRWNQGDSQEDAIAQAVEGYAVLPDWCNTDDLVAEWMLERQIVAVMLAGYFWRWGKPQRVIASEFGFDMQIKNPDTGHNTPIFNLAGKIDGIVTLEDGRLAVAELKTTGESIEPDSDYWKRLRIDQQISAYFLAARAKGHDVQTVLYDVIRKPSIRPKLVKGVRETVEEYGVRLTADIGERPDFYFARQEIPRLESDIEEFRWELWQLQGMIRDCQRLDRWPRNTSACLTMGRCPYFDLCCDGWKPENGLPAGFTYVDRVHSELAPNPKESEA